jgi:hypothetical protein
MAGDDIAMLLQNAEFKWGVVGVSAKVTFNCHWKSMDSYIAFCRSYSVPTKTEVFSMDTPTTPHYCIIVFTSILCRQYISEIFLSHKLFYYKVINIFLLISMETNRAIYSCICALSIVIFRNVLMGSEIEWKVLTWRVINSNKYFMPIVFLFKYCVLIMLKWNIELLQIFIFELVQYTFYQYFCFSKINTHKLFYYKVINIFL